MQITIFSSQVRPQENRQWARFDPGGGWRGVCPALFYVTELLTHDKHFTLEGWSIFYRLCPRAELGKELV